MPIYSQIANDALITGDPCRLHSITFTNDGSNEAKCNVYDGRNANAADLVVTLTRRGYGTWQFSWKGLELHKGLYIDDVERCSSITVEWEHQTLPE